MRIISGIHKGRPLHPPKNLPVRPTTDKAKESLFNILNNRLDYEEICTLELFAGTGNISYEFCSRGVKKAVAVDGDFRCVKYIKSVAEQLNMPLQGIKANAFGFIQQHTGQYDLIFADPPYDLSRMNEIPDLVLNSSLLKTDGIFILEHSRDQDFSQHPLLL